jgi:HK97 family phage major capsid protein
MDNKEHIKREVDARVKDEMDARAILDLAAEEKRSTTPEEDVRFEAFIASADVRKARIAKLSALDTDDAAIAEQVRSRIGDVTSSDSGSPEPTRSSENEQIVELVRSMFAEEQNGEIFLPYDETRAIADFSDSASLYVSDFSRQVTVYARTLSPWTSLATVINGDNGRPLILPNLTVDPTTYTPGEGTAITESTPTLGTVTATLISYKALSYVSFESAQDELVGLLPLLARQQGRSIGMAFGSAETTAVLSAATNGGTAGGLGGGGTATFFGLDDLITLAYSAPAPFRIGGVGTWIMANAAISKARKFVDTQGQYLWSPSNQVGQPDILLGFPVYEDPNLSAPASATKSVIFGDPSMWTIKAAGMRVAVSDQFRFSTDQIAIKSVYRAGGALPDATALRYLVSATT